MEPGSDSETEQLIRAVESKPFLYDKKHGDYKKVFLKKQAWESIAAEIPSFEDALAAERRWNSLRGKYSTEMLRIKSGDLGLSQLNSKWRYFDSLSFLKDHVNPRTNVNQGYIHVRQSSSNSWSPEFAQNNNASVVTTEQYYNNLLNLLSNNDDNSLDNSNGNDFSEKKPKIDELPKVNKPVKPKRTSSRVFGEYVGEALQELHESDSLEAQMKIMQLLMQYKKRDQSN